MFGQQKPSGGLFGAATQPAQSSSGFSFGVNSGTSNVSSTGGFTFGQTTTQPSAGFTFGSTSAAPTVASSNPGGVFSSTTVPAQGGVFGSLGGGFQFSKPAATTQSAGFTFGSATTSGFSLGTTSTPSTQPASSGGLILGSGPGNTGFTFGSQAPPASNAGTGFTLGTAASTSLVPGGFSLGKTPASTAAPNPGLTLGGTPVASAGLLGSSLGAPKTQASEPTLGQTPSQGFTFGGGTSTAAKTTSAPAFSLGGTTTSSGPSAFSLGGATTGSTANVGFSLGAKAPTSTSSTSFTLGSAANPGLSLGGTVTNSAPASAGFSLGLQPGTGTLGSLTLGLGLAKTTASSTTTAAATGLSHGFKPPTTSSTSTITAPGLSLGGAGSIKTGTSLTTTSLSTATTTVASGSGSIASSGSAPGRTASGTTSTVPQLTYKQLEELINKWDLELEDHERTFLDQAAQVNAWDRLLMGNGEKVTELNANVEAVKAEQKRLDQELEFIMAQQRELEDMLKPLEESVSSNNIGSRQLQQADKERDLTYKLAKDIDGQLKQMVQDLKSIIDHINTANTQQQDTEDPIAQIAKILNAHMDSLQWIDQNSSMLQRKVEEITRLNDTRRKEQERNFRLAFD